MVVQGMMMNNVAIDVSEEDIFKAFYEKFGLDHIYSRKRLEGNVYKKEDDALVEYEKEGSKLSPTGYKITDRNKIIRFFLLEELEAQSAIVS